MRRVRRSRGTFAICGLRCFGSRLAAALNNEDKAAVMPQNVIVSPMCGISSCFSERVFFFKLPASKRAASKMQELSKG